MFNICENNFTSGIGRDHEFFDQLPGPVLFLLPDFNNTIAFKNGILLKRSLSGSRDQLPGSISREYFPLRARPFNRQRLINTCCATSTLLSSPFHAASTGACRARP